MARIGPDATAIRLRELLALHLRAPVGVETDDATGLPVADFVPPLTVGEQATYDELLALARSRVVGITRTEWQALQGAIADLRAFRTQSAAEFSALTAAQRDAALRTALFGCIDVLRALLRD